MKKFGWLIAALVLLCPASLAAQSLEIEGKSFEFQLPPGFLAQNETTASSASTLLDEIGVEDREDFLFFSTPEAALNNTELLLVGKQGRHVISGMSEDDFAMFILFVSMGLMAEDESNPFASPAVMDQAEDLQDVVITLSEERIFSFSAIVEEAEIIYAAMVSYYHSADNLFNIIQVGKVLDVQGYNAFIQQALSKLDLLAIRPVVAE